MKVTLSLLLGLASALLAPNFAHGQNLRPHDETAFLEKLAPGLPKAVDPNEPWDEKKHVNHDLVFDAARSQNGMGYVAYEVDLHPQFQYVLEMEVDVNPETTHVLDDAVENLLSVEGEGGSQLVFSTLPKGWSVGDHIVGSHEGRWNELFDLEHPIGYGVTYSRIVAKMHKDRRTGHYRLFTTKANPQSVVSRSGMKLALNFTEAIRDTEGFSRRLEDDANLKKWCEDACKEREYYRKEASVEELAEMEVDICYKCVDFSKAHKEIINFNFDSHTMAPLYPEFNIGNGEGIVCHDCYAYLGTRIDFELEYTSLYVKRFKLMYGGHIGFNYNVTIDDPTFPPFWETNYEKFPEPDGPGALKITPEVRIPIGPPKPAPPPAPPGTMLPCNDISPLMTPMGALNALGLRFFDTCTLWLEFEGDFGMKLMGLGSAKGSTGYSYGLAGDLELGVQYTKFSSMENGQWRFANADGTNLFGLDDKPYSPPQTADFSQFKTNGISVEMTFLPLIRMSMTGGTFPFNMINLVSELEFAPYIGYTAFPGENEGTFSVTVTNEDTSKDGSVDKPHLGGDKLKIRIDYSGYEREDAIFLAIRNDCWEKDSKQKPVEFLPLMSQRATFTGTGSVEMEWIISYNDLFSTKQLDTGGFLCGVDPFPDEEYGGILCTDWLTSCNKNEWRIYPKVATQPFMDIDPSNAFAMFVNDRDNSRGIGVTEPKDKVVAKAGEPFTFKWDHLGFTQYAGNAEISSAVPLDAVDIKLYYLQCTPAPFGDCISIPGTFYGWEEHHMLVTEPNVGTPNDGEETIIIEECTSNGHKLSDAAGLAGASVYAVIQGIDNTNVVSRMDGEFYVEEAKCGSEADLVDISFSFGESFLKVNQGFGDNLQLGIHIIQTWWEEETERFTPEHDCSVEEDGNGGYVNNGLFSWNDTLPFKQQCPHDCMKIELTQDGLMGGKCVIWGGSIDMFRRTFKQGQYETILIDVDNCDFIAGVDDEQEAASMPTVSVDGVVTTNVIPPFVTIMWEDGITCPPGEYLDDNWFLMEKFFEKDSCKVCPANEYSATKGETCDKCPDGKVIESDVPAGHDSPGDCKSCVQGKYYTRKLEPTVDFEGVDVYSPYYCEVCDIDEYNEQLGATSCTKCPRGTGIRNQPTAAGHFSSKQCVKLCDSSHFYVEGGLYCIKKKWGMCIGGFGYEEHAWCARCEQCDTTECEAECAGHNSGRRLAEEEEDGEEEVLAIFTRAERGIFDALLEEAEGRARTEVHRSSLHDKKMEKKAADKARAAAHSAGSPTPTAAKLLAPKFRVPEDQRAYLSNPNAVDDRDDGELGLRDLTSTTTCDKYYWGIGLKGGITNFRIVNPGGGLHKNMFEIDLYKDEDGQLDFNMVGPILTDKHFYQYCDAMTPPTWDTGINCDPGSYSNDGSGQGPCTVCGKNTYSNAAQAASCTTCPVGKYIEDDAGVDVTFHDSADDCVDMKCPPGRYLSDSAKAGNDFTLASCLACATGKFKNTLDANACTDCARGTYQKLEGSTSCSSCTQGTYADSVGQVSCTGCSAGKWSKKIGANHTGVCVDCGAGLYSEKVGASTIDTCVQCPVGKKSSVAGASGPAACVECAAGTYARRTASTTCDICPTGTYSVSSGSSACESCAYGKFSETAQATSASVCTLCPAGTYSGALGSTSCTNCTKPSKVSQDGSECVEQFDFNEDSLPDDQGGDGEGQVDGNTAAPTPTPQQGGGGGSSTEPFKHECAKECPESFLLQCDPSLLTHACSSDCDAQLIAVYKSYFEQLCPPDFVPPAIGFIKIESGEKGPSPLPI